MLFGGRYAGFAMISITGARAGEQDDCEQEDRPIHE